jgi:hypothetical protein
MATVRSSFIMPESMNWPLSSGFAEDDPYPMIRSVLAPEYASLPAAHLESVLASNGMRAEDMEGFFDDVGHAFNSAAKAVAPVASRALPGALSGALAGCALGPWGCLGGAVVGGVGSALASTGGKSGGAQAARTIGSVASALPSLAGGLKGAGGAGASGGVASTLASALPMIAGIASSGASGSPQTMSAPAGMGSAPAAPRPPSPTSLAPRASSTSQATHARASAAAAPDRDGAQGTEPVTPNPAGVLLGLVQHPQFLQALMAMSLGNAGKQNIEVGSTEVPVSAFANLGSVLAGKAFRQAELGSEPTEDLPAYLYTEGALTVDPGAPSERAARLLIMLGDSFEPLPSSGNASNSVSLSEADSYYDALDVAELGFLDAEGLDAEGEDGEYDD